MPQKEIYAYPNTISPANPVIFDPEICNGCNTCVNVCQIDVFIPNPVPLLNERGDLLHARCASVLFDYPAREDPDEDEANDTSERSRVGNERTHERLDLLCASFSEFRPVR